jgi:signal transduction histidine kinase
MGIHGPVSHAQREALTRVGRSQRHLLSLINEVLNLTRIESGRIDYAMEDFALAPLVEETVSMLEPLIATSRLTCDVTVELPLPVVPVAVRGDREKVHQILVNLLTNAIKFTPAGGRISIQLSAAGDAADLVCLRITDTGIGIASAHLEQIFEPFVQVGVPVGYAKFGAAGATRRREGVGLGLAISRDLARGMGGDLDVVSTLGVGTTFSLTLPAAAR